MPKRSFDRRASPSLHVRAARNNQRGRCRKIGPKCLWLDQNLTSSHCRNEELGCGILTFANLWTSEMKYKTLEDEALVRWRGTELRIGAGDEFQAAREIGAVAVAAGLGDECVGGEGGDAEAGPEHLPHRALITDLLFVEHEHLAERFGEREDVADGEIGRAHV